MVGLQYFPNYLHNTEDLFNTLSQLNWRQNKYSVGEREILVPRLSLTFHQNDYPPLPLILVKIKDKIESEFNKTFSLTVLNYYRDGRDYTKWEIDKELFGCDSIYCLSFGTVRKIQFRPVGSTTISHQFLIGNNSLTVMDYEIIKNSYEYCFPKQLRVKEGRISVTFRER
jgi:alkylated DNA repair dioxygenase AlkB